MSLEYLLVKSGGNIMTILCLSQEMGDGCPTGQGVCDTSRPIPYNGWATTKMNSSFYIPVASQTGLSLHHYDAFMSKYIYFTAVLFRGLCSNDKMGKSDTWDRDILHTKVGPCFCGNCGGLLYYFSTTLAIIIIRNK
jgi:hypothetical protein